jgi:hypothetical protein
LRRDVACEEAQPLPPASHHQHEGVNPPEVRWQLIVWADYRPTSERSKRGEWERPGWQDRESEARAAQRQYWEKRQQ